MSQATPLPRSKRRRDYVATPGQTVFDDADFLVFDAEDVRVRQKLPGASGFATLTTGFTVALSAQPAGNPKVTFADGRVGGAVLRVESARVHGRTTDVTRGGALNTVLLEREEDKQAAALMDMRRDLDDIDTNEASAARDEAIAARDDIRKLYLGAFDHFPTAGEVGFPFVNGIEFFLTDQPDPLNDGKYVWQDGQWYPAGERPEAYSRAVVVFVDAGIAATGIVPVPGGYLPGLVDVLRSGVDMLIGSTPGNGVLDPDCTAADGLTVVFPAGVLQLDEPVKIVRRKPIAIGTATAADILYGGETVKDALDQGVRQTRTIATSGLATGGGSLAADRTIGVPVATEDDALEGLLNDKAMTPLRTAQAIAAALSAGLIHVAVDTTLRSTSGTSYVAAGPELVFTPKSAASKIVGLVALNVGFSAAMIADFTIYRNGVAITPSGKRSILTMRPGSSDVSDAILPAFFIFEDEPNTAAAVTYSLRWKTNTGALYLGRRGSGADLDTVSATIVALES